MRTLVLVLLLACKDEEKPRDVAADLQKRTVEVATQAKDKSLEVAAEAKERLGGDIGEKAKETAEKAKETAGKALDTAAIAYDKALLVGKSAKAELDKVYKSNTDYALAVDEVGSDDAAKHAAQLDKMPSVEVKGVRVGYEEDSQLSLRGTTYAKHFRASWKRSDNKVVRVSFYTKETLDLVAFAQLLQKIVPAVEKVI